MRSSREVDRDQIRDVLASYDTNMITHEVALGHIARIVDYAWQARDADGGTTICGTCGEEIDADDDGCPDEGRDA